MGMQEVLNKYDCLKGPNSQKEKKKGMIPSASVLPTLGQARCLLFTVGLYYFKKCT